MTYDAGYPIILARSDFFLSYYRGREIILGHPVDREKRLVVESQTIPKSLCYIKSIIPLARLVGRSFCHFLLRRTGSCTSKLLSEHLFLNDDFMAAVLGVSLKRGATNLFLL